VRRMRRGYDGLGGDEKDEKGVRRMRRESEG
jgi:hypothetical protein